MKYLNKILYLFMVSAVLTSCNREVIDTNIDNAKTIFFTNSEANLFVEEGASNTINISIGSTALATSNISYSISVDETSTALEGVDFQITNTSTSFSQGQIVTNLTIVGDFDNALVDGKTATLILTSTDAKVSESNTFNLNLFKLCPFVGLNTNSYMASVYAFGEEAPSHNVSLVAVAGTTNQWTVTSSWGPEFVAWATGNPAYSGLFLYSGTLVVNDDFTVDFIGDDAWATGGAGTFSPCTQEFAVTLNQGLFTSAFTTDVVFAPM